MYERVGERLLCMIRDNLERDQVFASVSSIKDDSVDSEDGGEDASISEAERNRILIEKMSQGQPERKRSYSASKSRIWSFLVCKSCEDLIPPNYVLG